MVEGRGSRPIRHPTYGVKELVALRQVLKRARRRGEYRRDPAEVLPVGFVTKYEPRRVLLTLEQAAELLGYFLRRGQGHRAAVVAFILATSARKSEAFGQRVADIQADTGMVRLRGTKTKASDRNVKVAAFARPLLAFSVQHGGAANGILFRPWPNMRRGLEHACKAIGAPRVTPNDLRRTLSTWLIEAGVSDVVVAKVLGHVDTTMVHRVYGRPRDEAVADLLEKQAARIPSVPVGAAPIAPAQSDVNDTEQQRAPTAVSAPARGETFDSEMEKATVRLLYASQPVHTRLEPSPTLLRSRKAAEFRGPSGTRTRDLRIKSPQLCRLSYQPE